MPRSVSDSSPSSAGTPAELRYQAVREVVEGVPRSSSVSSVYGCSSKYMMSSTVRPHRAQQVMHRLCGPASAEGVRRRGDAGGFQSAIQSVRTSRSVLS